METASRLCPDPEVLAAFSDQGLGADESVQVEAHLAGCDRCRAIVARVLDTRSAVPEAGSAAPMPGASASARAPAFTRVQIAWGAGSLLAAAAVLALMIDAGTGSRLADLAAAVGDERPVEARLTGGFRHGPLRSPVRSGGSPAASDDWTVYAAAGRIREDADRDPSAPNLHALGLAHLVLGQYDEAVRALEDAIAEDSEQARYHSDLAAAYFARARHVDRPDDFPRALGAAERALEISDSLLEARFNRALALEALFLNDQAQAAWQDYLARDSSSGWASEARAHVQKLQQSVAPLEGARNNSPPPITDMSVEAGLDWLLQHGLPAWAEAVLAHDFNRASVEYSHLSSYAQQLTAANGDPIAASLLQVADPARTPPTAASVIREFGRGIALLRSDDMAEAERVLSAACRDVAGVFRTLCDLEVGRFDIIRRRGDEAERRLRSPVMAVSASPYVESRIELLAGYRLMFQGDYAGAIKPYESSFNRLRAAKYLSLAENVAAQLGDMFELVGLPRESWGWRYRALQLSALTGGVQTYWTRLSIGDSLARNENFHAARAFVAGSDASEIGELGGPRGALLEMARARISLALGDVSAARAAFDRAEHRIADSRGVSAQRMTSELLLLRADLERREGQFDRARQTLDEMLPTVGPERTPHRVFALLTRAGLSKERHEWQADAARDVTDAIQLLRARTAPIDQPVRLQDVLPAFDATASLVSSQQSLQGLRGLYLVEQLNQLLNGVPSSHPLVLEEDLQRAFKALEPGVAMVVYLFSDRSLLTWVVSVEDIQFRERSVTSRDVLELASRLATQVSRTPAREDLLRQTLSGLHDLVLSGLPIVDSARELIVIPAGPINRVPMGALYDRSANQYLFQRTAVRTAPNLALALTPARTNASSAAKSAVIIGNPALTGSESAVFPPLPDARTEAVEVAKSYPHGTVMVGEEATKDRVLASIGNADVIHFAGHAIAPRGGQAPRLLLAGDARDSRDSIASSDLATRLPKGVRVVLAACETGATTIDRASSLTSISSAFLRAGAASVVATLWEVEDRSSATLFPTVHRGLAAGQKAAVAVALAQRSCLADALCRRSAATWIGTTAHGFQ